MDRRPYMAEGPFVVPLPYISPRHTIDKPKGTQRVPFGLATLEPVAIAMPLLLVALHLPHLGHLRFHLELVKGAEFKRVAFRGKFFQVQFDRVSEVQGLVGVVHDLLSGESVENSSVSTDERKVLALRIAQGSVLAPAVDVVFDQMHQAHFTPPSVSSW